MAKRCVPALIRLLLAFALLGLFIYAYLSGSLNANGILALLVKGQFSAALHRTGILDLTVIAILAFTLIFGRCFCSILCPLGTLQELFWRAGNFLGLKKGKKEKSAKGIVRTGYTAMPKIRYAIPVLVGAGAAFSLSPLMMAIDPISTFGRGMGALRALLGGGAVPLVLILALPLTLILVVAFFRGRAFCNWCPVGVTFGLFSSAAPFAVQVSSRCVSCGLCEKKCPAGCINSREKRIDSDRCVLCGACAAACPTGSVSYGARGKAAVSGEARRVFLKGAGKASLFCGGVYLLGPSLKLFSRPPGGSATAALKLPILPPGAKSGGHYHARCVGCQACVASCPVGIIKPGDSPHPVLHYTSASCQFNCIECGKVCPTGAIRRLTVEEKRRTRIALSSLAFERCVVNTKRESCGACAEVCPTGAITMTVYSESGVPWLTRPVFDAQYCIGCGACLVACPADPRALIIEAVPEQTLTVGIRPPEEAGDELRIQNMEDFPF
jgi:ferredoxin